MPTKITVGALTIAILILSMLWAVLLMTSNNNYTKCLESRCPSGYSPRYVYKPSRCICEIPAQ